MTDTNELIKKYYDAFNQGDMVTFIGLLDDNVVHDINQGQSQSGKTAFQKFMEHMNTCYKETIQNLEVMVNQQGTRAAAEFQVDGEYLQTDKGLPPARHQKYSLPAGAFFEIKNNKITRITTYYNLNEWLKQVS